MAKCKYCGSELGVLDGFGNTVWICPNDCAFLKAWEEENARSEAERRSMHEDMPVVEPAAGQGNMYEDMLAVEGDEVSIRHSHCWTYTARGNPCPGTVLRVIEAQDGPYGHFCPVCGHSLRYHYHLGEGKPGDMARRRR